MSQLHIALRRAVYSPGCLSSPLSRRCFSHYSPLRAAPKQPQPARPTQAAERSMKVVQKELAQIPSDLGILEGTFITPRGKNAPSLFRTPRSFLKLHYHRIKYRFRDRLSLLVLKFTSPKEKGFLRRSLKISRSTVKPTAVALHRQMYTSFAEGDIASLRRICTDGIYESFRGRIGSRPRGETVQWELVKYNKRSRIVSDRGMKLLVDGAAVRQAVVRICSRQKLTRLRRVKNGDAEVVPGSGKEKDVVEYVVLQQRLEAWKPGPWQVWGTTGETTLQDLEEWEKKALE
ncbi:uncharacterized protein PAC_14011 [Phialocephala subalpina]|uniref:Tim44-like domain-containing protein n=1 Tax=Phialocephala subalpina TaxID=576137 RepID=A0A1L7XGG7_9HELO|nr:uncharacterized protein PAC_14011 [Phialocephala subalpina]